MGHRLTRPLRRDLSPEIGITLPTLPSHVTKRTETEGARRRFLVPRMAADQHSSEATRLVTPKCMLVGLTACRRYPGTKFLTVVLVGRARHVIRADHIVLAASTMLASISAHACRRRHGRHQPRLVPRHLLRQPVLASKHIPPISVTSSRSG